MLRKPPHVLVTTPESLYILLTAEKSRALFARVSDGHRRRDPRDGRRQARLAPGADARAARRPRAARRAAAKPQRIGLSATVRPLERSRASLSPTRADRRRRPPARRWTLAVEVPERRTRRGREQRDVGRDLRPHRRAHPRAPHDARVRQHAAHERAGRVRARRSGWAKASCCRITAVSRASIASRPNTG